MNPKPRSTDAADPKASDAAEGLIRMLEGLLGSSEEACAAPLGRLAKYVEKTNAEIEALAPMAIARHRIPAARAELDAIGRDVSDAAERILTSAAALLSDEAADPQTYKAFVQDHAIQILEACIFNDLVGQRLSKVTGELTTVEARLTRLSEELGVPDHAEVETPTDHRNRDLILNGPQLSHSDVQQDDIDKLFNAS